MPKKPDIKVILFAVGGFLLLIFILMLLGIIPGLKKTNTGPVVKGTIIVWTIDENKQAVDFWENTLKKFKQLYPGVTVTHRGFPTKDVYEATLLDALSAGEGPDVFQIENTAVPRYANKIVPASETQFSLQTLRDLFPKVVEQDFAADGKVSGLPLSIDTLALLYNRNLFDQAALQAPISWENFQDIVPRLTKVQDLKITTAGAAFGTSEKNIETASDILGLLIMQNGIKMTDDKFTRVTFDEQKGVDALSFYTSFANPTSPAYTWNENMPNAIDAMSQEQVAMIIDYSSAIQKIKERNNFLDIGIGEVPSPQEQIDKNKKMSFARYPGFVVSKQTKSNSIAWQFIATITTNQEITKNFVTQTQKPPALRSLLLSMKNDPQLSVFVRQALVASSWRQIDDRLVKNEFSKMITAVNEQTNPWSAIKDAANNISEKMSK
jgi:multiple sugar transport system substrate-binding protein